MWKLTLCLIVAAAAAAQNFAPKSGDELVSAVLENCLDENCVKVNVLRYLDGVLKLPSDEGRDLKNIDAAIFKRAAKILKTHEIRYKLPEMVFDRAELVYSPRTGLDLVPTKSEARGLLKKKLLLPILLLLKLKMKALLPIFVALIGLKALKALILSKLAIGIVLGFIIYQLCTKAGMPMPMAMSMGMPPSEPPSTAYGAPSMMSTAPPSSYEPGWEPNQGGPYARVWTPSNNDNQNGQSAQNLAYSAYYQQSSSTTTRP